MPRRSTVPIRIGGSRVRTGCRMCKQRHIKCDEGQPVCLRCQRANRQCVYDSSQPQSQSQPPIPSDSQDPELVISSTLQPRNHLAWPSPSSGISPYASLELAETSAIQHFALNLGKELAGSFSNSVWCDVLPRVAQHEPSIWHGLVAVSTLDQNLRRDYVSHERPPDRMAIMHYSKAMQKLQTRLASAEESSCKDVVLLCCVLFAVFECLQSHYHSALLHISGGIKLLVEWGGEGQLNNQVTLGSYLNRTMLQSVFLSLDSQAIQLGAPGFRDFSTRALDDQFPIASFATIENAHLMLNQIFHRLSQWGNWAEPVTVRGNKPNRERMLEEKQRIKAQLGEWDVAFNRSLHLYDTQPATYLLLLQRSVMKAILGKADDGSSEMEWDKYLPLFEESVTHAEVYMRLTANSRTGASRGTGLRPTQSERPRPALTIAMDIVLPLFLISTRCRDATVRGRALQVLRTCNRQEGIWNSWSCANIAAKVIEFEESAASEHGQIPDHARVYMLDIQFAEEQIAEVSLVVQNENGYHRAVSMNEGVAC